MKSRRSLYFSLSSIMFLLGLGSLLLVDWSVFNKGWDLITSLPDLANAFKIPAIVFGFAIYLRVLYKRQL